MNVRCPPFEAVARELRRTTAARPRWHQSTTRVQRMRGFLTRMAVACTKRTHFISVPLRSEGRWSWTSSLSAFGLFLVFAGTAFVGANIFAFQVSGAGSVSAWTNTTGVAAQARILAFQIGVATQADTAAIDNALDEMVKASPTSAAAWQVRAAYQLAHGAPMEYVLAGFRMSALTGSHEGYYMAQRAMFGLQHWSELPEEDRHTAVRDLVGSEAERYRNVLAAKSEAERDEIRAAVIASGRASKTLLQVLGD